MFMPLMYWHIAVAQSLIGMCKIQTISCMGQKTVEEISRSFIDESYEAMMSAQIAFTTLISDCMSTNDSYEPVSRSKHTITEIS